MSRKFALLGLWAAVVAAAWPAGATAAYSHATVEGSFLPGCTSVNDIAVDEHNDYVYVSCGDPVLQRADVKRFHLDGTPADFSAVEPYLSGNTITEDPGSSDGDFGWQTYPKLAVDNSASPNQGKLFVTSSPNVEIFDVSGKFFAPLTQPVESSIPNVLGGVDVGPDGSIYVTSNNPGDRISKYDTAFHEVKKLYGSHGYVDDGSYGASTRIAVDGTGAVWSRHDAAGIALVKYEADQFTTELSIPAFGATAAQLEPFIADPSPFAPNPLLSTEIAQFDVDLTDNDLYVDRGDRVNTFSPGDAEESAHQDAPAFGIGVLKGSVAVAVTYDHHVYTSTESGGAQKIIIFGPGDVLPDVHTYKPNADEVGHNGATVRGRLEPAGGDPITECWVEYRFDEEWDEPGTEKAGCTPDPSVSSFSDTTAVSADVTGLTSGETYYYRFVAGNGHGTNAGITRTLVPAFVLKVKTLAAEGIGTSGATLRGSLDPDGMPTTYHFDYGIDSGYGLSTEEQSAGAGVGEEPVAQALEGLPSGRVFHYRLVATNGNGTTYGPDMSFRTGSEPDLSGVRATEVAATSAVLRANVSPVGYDTTYYFEYGTTPGYGQVAPISPADIGAGTDPVAVSQEIDGLQYGVTYHYRVVAANKWGTAQSSDTTFDFTPPSCPNDHVRQQTTASYLPDCRAYELVSPGDAGAVLLYPTFAVTSQGTDPTWNPFFEHMIWPLNKGFAASPSRFAFFGGVGSITGLFPPNNLVDTYMATRTNTGWVTTVPGLRGDETYDSGRRECSEALDLCIDHSETTTSGFKREYAPYLFAADGEKLGRLPTNVGVIPEGTLFVGPQRMSGDFSHFVFGSVESERCWFCGVVKPAIAFAPGGVTTGMGSLYDNDIASRTVTVVSKLPNGDDLPEEVPTTGGVGIRGISADGSHILMQTPAADGGKHLFLRVGDAVTYDVSEGAGVAPIGMTRDGSKVFFTTAAPLAAEDSDTSVDLYVWSEADGKAELVSQGGGAGNSDSCDAAWQPGNCDVAPLTPEYAYPDQNRMTVANGAQDDLFAEVSGDVYFYSSELLDPTRPGIRNQRNLYVFHQGAVQLVATLDPGTQINRMQISPDGAHAAMVTASQLTSYDSRGFREMYTYEPDTGAIRCASCNPDGTPPSGDVVASEGGRFMANDGRAFFTTAAQLVARDRNGKVLDVYEYVNGRPQLITSGLGSRDFTGGSETLSLLLPAVHTGLEAVSRNGRDVYFSTFDTLVDQDHNGQFVKFYDARTDGGFPVDPVAAPCAAADECHGPSSAPPPPPISATATDLGSGGNLAPQRRHRKRHGKRRHKHTHSKKSHRSGRSASHG